jgi:hypothetical protein
MNLAATRLLQALLAAVVVFLAIMLATGCAARRNCFVGSYTGDRLCTANGRITFEPNLNFPSRPDLPPKYRSRKE